MRVTSNTTSSWPAQPGSGQGRSHGTSASTPFDRWFRYPAGFASDYVSMLLDRLAPDGGGVIDCFAGSGVTGTAARLRGLDFVGIEAHPMISELAQLKVAPQCSPDQVEQLAQAVATIARQRSGRVPIDGETELVQRSFATDVLRDLVSLRSEIQARIAEPGAQYAKWALLATLRDVAGVKVGWPYQRPGVARKPRYHDAIARFTTRVTSMVQDLQLLQATPGRAQVLAGDSQDRALWEKIEVPVLGCVASPPYLNNFDYADATRLESYFWGDVATWAEMCRDIRSDMLVATTQQSSVGTMRSALTELSAMRTTTSTEIVELVTSITAKRQQRPGRSKEYDQVAPPYFLAMSRILSNLHEQLEGGGTALWLVGDSAPYGVYIDTPRLIGGLAVDAGFEFVEDVSLRARGNRWATNGDRHQVPLAERLIVLKKA